MSKHHSKNVRYALAGAMLLASVSVSAQQISGTVKDANGEPIIGATIMEQGTQNGTVTDFDGNFSLNLKKAGNLNISYVGMKSQVIKTAGKSSFNITLEDDATTLNDVVVIGYGTVKKKDLTGSVASVKAEDLGNVAGANVMQAMQAKVPGVDLQQSDGQAGSGVSITMRGNRSILASNNPLVIVDGVEYGSTLDIPASEIESMDVLKDAASTAIYGTKGANGVIIITTKRGSSGKTKVNFSAYWAFKSPANVLKPMYGTKEVQRLIDAANYETARNNGWDFSKGTATAESVLGSATNNGVKLIDIYNDGSYTDWLDGILQNSTSQNYEINVGGGNQKTNFNVAFSLMDDRGMMKNDQMSRYTGRANIDHEISKYVKIGTSLSFAYKSNDKRNSGVYNQALKMTTITHAYGEDGTINAKPSYFYDAHCSPLLDEVDGAYQRNIETTRFFGSAYVQVTPIKNLILKSNFTVDLSNQRNGLYQDYQSQGRFQSPSTSYISNARETDTKWVMQNTANYNITASKHNIGVLLGNEVTHSVIETSSIAGDAGQNHYYESSYYDVSKITSPAASTGYTKTSMVSFFGRVNYSFDDRYLLQASLRGDGSSVLADGNKWGVFPSVSAGWRITEEKFMQGSKNWLDNLKLRLSWGISGNAAIDAYQTLGSLSPIVPNSTDMAPMTQKNPNLTWEKTSAFDIGLDYGFLGGRINGSIDYYWSKTYDLLYYMTAPASTVYTATIGNVGESKGHGFEFSLNAIPVKSKDFQWDINASLTMSRDEITSLYGDVDKFVDGDDILKVGESISSYYQYEADGCWNIGEFDQYVKENYTDKGKKFTQPVKQYGDPGTTKIVDQNGDGVIDDNDKIVYNRSPKAILGMTNTFSYKGFSLSIQMMARLGGYMKYQGYNLFTYDKSNWGDLDYWTPENTDAIIPSPAENKDKVSGMTTYKNAIMMQAADYFKIKDITLAYTFDQNLLKKTGFLSSARVYCSLKNFITSGHIKGYDSERGGAVTFPLAKQVVVGLNVSF